MLLFRGISLHFQFRVGSQMRHFSLGVAVILLTGAAHAHAADVALEPDFGSYFGIAGGLNNISNGTALAPRRPPSARQYKFHDGLAAGATVGYRFGALRGELELTYRSNGVK